jgi:hypothetical protein
MAASVSLSTDEVLIEHENRRSRTRAARQALARPPDSFWPRSPTIVS